MAVTDSDSEIGPGRRAIRVRANVKAAIITVGVGGTIVAGVIHFDPGDPVLPTLAAVFMFAGMVLAAFDTWQRYKSEDEEQAQNRQRVRDAESDLESALRIVPIIYHGGQLVSLPVADEGAPDPALPRQAQETSPPLDVDSIPETVGDLALPALWKVTHARLGQYHVTAVGQAKRAFRNAQYAMGAGFVLLAVFVYAAFNAKSATASATAGVLGAVAAALAGYIARTFIRSQEMTSQALHRYFEEPLVLSRYLAAERLVRDAGISEEKKADLLYAIVHSMITGEPPGKQATALDAPAPEE